LPVNSWMGNQSGGLGGQPNPNLSIISAAATNSPAAWQTCLSKEQFLLRQGASPGSWTRPRYPSPMITTGNLRLPLLGGFSKLAVTQSETVDDRFEEAFVSAPLIDQQTSYVLFEVRLNQSEFTYLGRTGDYDAARQRAAFPTNATPTFFPMPQTRLDLPTNTGDMRNVTMETYAWAINKRNCTDCHGLRFPKVTPAAASLYQTNGDYQIFTFLLGGCAELGPGGRCQYAPTVEVTITT